PLVFGYVARVLAEHERPAGGREQQPLDQLDRGRLARAVGAEQSEDLPLFDLDVERFQRRDLLAPPKVAVDLAEVPGFNDHVRIHRRWSRSMRFRTRRGTHEEVISWEYYRNLYGQSSDARKLRDSPPTGSPAKFLANESPEFTARTINNPPQTRKRVGDFHCR